MFSQQPKWARIVVALFATLSFVTSSGAAENTPTDTPDAATKLTLAQSQANAVLARYAGYYRIGEQRVLHLVVEEESLFVQLTGHPPVEVFANNDTEFAAKAVKLQGTVMRDAQDQASAIVLRQNGQDTTLPRINEALALQINAALATKIKNQLATPGSEAALRRLIAQLRENPPNLARLSTNLAAFIKSQQDRLRAMQVKLGEVKAITFAGIDGLGWDQYRVRYENGSLAWFIQLGVDGTIDGAFVTQ